jgi:lipoate-protein ligase A
MKIVSNNSTDKRLKIREYNYDNDLIENVKLTCKPALKVYQPTETAVVLGRGSDPIKEINYTLCDLDGTPLYQRSGGGCAVVIDPGNVVVSVVLPTEGFSNNRRYFNKLSQWLIDKLENIGIHGVYQDGISDLVYNNKKIGGSSIQRTKDYLYYSTTLLVKPEVNLMERYLAYPPREPEYRKGRSHSDFVGTLPANSVTELAQTLSTKLYHKNVINELKL